MAVAVEQTQAYGEVRVETGTGLVEKVEQKPGARNAHVVIKATHTNLREPVSAWADTFDGAVWPTVESARDDRFEIEYRIEVRRKGDVDKAKPIAALGNREKVRELAAVARKGELSQIDRIQAPAAASPPAAPQAAPVAPEPESDGKSVIEAGLEATAQRAAHRNHPAATPPSSSGIRCELCDVDAATSAELLEHAKGAMHKANEERAKFADRQAAAAQAATFDSDAADRSRPVPPAPGRRRPRIEEAKPWELLNSDGSLNLASYSYQAVLGFVELAHDLASQRVRDVIADSGDAAEVKMGQVEALARMLLEAADRCQAMTRQDGRVDRMDASHTRARGAIRTALKVYPVPWGANTETRAVWLDNLAEHAASLTRIALDLFRLHETGEGR
jgi:hypothetical protein